MLLLGLLVVSVSMFIVPQQYHLVAGSSSNQTKTESEPNSLAGQDSKNQGSTDGETAGQPNSLDDDNVVTNQSEASSEDTSNLPSNNISQEAITTSPSDIISDNQTSNQTEETSKPRMFERQLSPDVLKDLQTLTPPLYKVKVVFDSMTVHNDHEGALSGDGEYDIAAYVQGIKVGLTDASGPGDGLWDVSSGESVTFDPGTEVAVDIPATLPLSIFTVGSEVDGCGRTVFPREIQETLNDLLSVPYYLLLGSFRDVHNDINKAINWVGCKLNPNDILGLVNVLYEPTEYGAGAHAEKSDKGDFTLKYTISVSNPPPTAEPENGNSRPKVLGGLDNNDLAVQSPNSSTGKKLDNASAAIVDKLE
jgi:hypothetical protein